MSWYMRERDFDHRRVALEYGPIIGGGQQQGLRASPSTRITAHTAATMPFHIREKIPSLSSTAQRRQGLPYKESSAHRVPLLPTQWGAI